MPLNYLPSTRDYGHIQRPAWACPSPKSPCPTEWVPLVCRCRRKEGLILLFHWFPSFTPVICSQPQDPNMPKNGLGPRVTEERSLYFWEDPSSRSPFPSRGEIKVYLGCAKINQKRLKQFMRLHGLQRILSMGKGQSPAQEAPEAASSPSLEGAQGTSGRRWGSCPPGNPCSLGDNCGNSNQDGEPEEARHHHGETCAQEMGCPYHWAALQVACQVLLFPGTNLPIFWQQTLYCCCSSAPPFWSKCVSAFIWLPRRSVLMIGHFLPVGLKSFLGLECASLLCLRHSEGSLGIF